VEHLADEVVHLRVAALARLLVVQEAGGGIRDRGGVVAHLEDRHAAHSHGDLLRVDALHVEDRLVGLERQVLSLLERRDHEGAAAGDDLEGAGGVDGALRRDAGDDQRLVGGRHAPERLEEDRDQHGNAHSDGDHCNGQGVHAGSSFS
jgi:hypothetical protein